MLIGNMRRHAKTTRKCRSSLKKPQRDNIEGGGKNFNQFDLKLGKQKKLSAKLLCKTTHIVSNDVESIVLCHR